MALTPRFFPIAITSAQTHTYTQIHTITPCKRKADYKWLRGLKDFCQVNQGICKCTVRHVCVPIVKADLEREPTHTHTHTHTQIHTRARAHTNTHINQYQPPSFSKNSNTPNENVCVSILSKIQSAYFQKFRHAPYVSREYVFPKNACSHSKQAFTNPFF